MRHRSVFALVCAVSLGCGSGDDRADEPELPPLDCAWLASDTNCWKASVAEAVACAPDAATKGTLSADRASCSYPDGSAIAFGAPLSLPIGQEHVWSFSIDGRTGNDCVKLEERSDGLELTTASGTFLEVASLSVTITCPDGSAFKGGAMKLLECENAFQILPGYSYQSSSSTVSLSLVGVPDPPPMFDCSSAP